mgnify:CR=1 FL=1
MKASLAQATIGVIERTAGRTQITDTDRKQTIQASERRGQRQYEHDAEYKSMIRSKSDLYR